MEPLTVTRGLAETNDHGFSISTAGFWKTSDGRWMICQPLQRLTELSSDKKLRDLLKGAGVAIGWQIMPISKEDSEERRQWLASVGLNGAFPTRREALSALNLALEGVTK